MFNAEVLSKFPVVQHFAFGSLFSWDPDPDAAKHAQQTTHLANQPLGTPRSALGEPMTSVPAAAARAGTAAPWANATSMPTPSGPGIPYTRAPFARPGNGPLPALRPMRLNPVDRRARDAMKTQDGGAASCPALGGGKRGTAAAQVSLTRAPWAKD